MIKFTLKHLNNVIVVLLVAFGGLFLSGDIHAQSVARSCDDDPIVLTSADFIGANATVESEAGSATVVEVGDIFRFNDVSAGIDCLVSVDAFINGASINSIDNLDATTGAIGGFDRAFQPVIEGDPGVNGQEVVFTFNFVVANTNISQAVSVYLTALDLDSNVAGDVERVKLEIPDAYYTNGANSQINITQTPTQIIGESNGSGIVNGINVDDSYSFTGYYNSFSSIEYTISKDGYNGGLGFEDRQFSLLFEDVPYSPEESVLLTNPIICGQVFVDGAPRAGVAVNLTGDSTQTTTTDANGQYSFTVSGNGNFTITETDLSGTVSLSDVDAGNDNIINVAITNFESSQENDFFDSILVSVGDVTVVEGDDGSTVVANFPVTLGAPADVNTTVTFTVSNGTGTLGDADYVAPTVLTVVIPAGQTSGVFPVTINGDDKIENNEQFSVSIASVSSGTINPAANTGVGTITNDDTPGVVSVSTEEELEGTSLVHDVVVTESIVAEVYPFVISNNSTEDEDYTLPTSAEFTNGVVLNNDGTITVPAGVTDFTVTVPTTDDAIDEEAEVYDLTVGGVAATGTITDNDDTVVSIDDVVVVEGDAGAVNADFTVSLTNPADTATTVTFTVTDDSAENAGNSVEGGNDYEVPTTLTVTIPAGETEGTVTVVVNGDETVEADEDFLVTLTATDNGTITTTVGDNIGTGTITNDDATVVSVGPVTVIEGNDGTTVLAEFPVSLTSPADTDTVVTFTVTDGSGTLGGADYVAPTELTVTIPAGQTTAVFPVTVNGDDVVESDEEFTVTIVSTTNGSIDPLASTAKGTITNDDTAGVVSVSTEEELEGTSLVHDVVVVESADAEVYPFVISNDSTEDEDYTLPTDAEFTNGVVLNNDGTITVPAGVTDFAVTVPTTDDAIDEEAEVYDLTVGTVAATGTITDNDDAGVVSVSTEEELEGTSLVHDVVVVESADAEVYPFVISNDSTEDEDYTLPTDAEFTNGVVLNNDGTITVPAGVTDFAVTVPTTDDAIDEEAEVYDLTVGTVAATGTITDNDDAGVVSVSTEEELEGTSLVHDVVVVESADAEVYPFVISNDSTEDEDYTLPTDAEFTNGVVLNNDGTITVPAGVTDFTVTVPTTDDAIDEEAEVYDLTVGGVAATGR
ncbi:beta strand repeat-containing protein [Dokdonia sp. Asnod1-B02]|uniref:beta strand repeat-containing protein n=1 Tax=Dokdonia sp. Asnod1-B02 TaxID=3160573 RepID=UPI00386859EE